MPARKHTKREREHHLAEVSRRYLDRQPQAQIARELGVSEAQVSYDLRRLHVQWVERAGMDFDAMRAEQLATIDQVEHELWQLYRDARARPRETTYTSQSEPV